VAGDGGAAIWAFEPTPRISSYITAIVAGPYEATFSELTSASGAVIPLGVYGRKSLWQHLDADYIFDKTREGFAYYEEKFGVPYPSPSTTSSSSPSSTPARWRTPGP
jgi:aminopeptidase N